MQISLKNARLLPVAAGLILLGAEPVLSSTFDRAIERCRQTIGRPSVQACLDAKGKGGAFELCRLDAYPKVRACVQGAMAKGGIGVQRAIAHCRQSAGRTFVEACMSAQGKRAELESCRARASPRVRACVRKSMIAVYGHAHVRQAIEHCRQTVGRPIVRACMGGNHGAHLQACRAEAFPKVRACVQRILRES
jgi:hypothetical protein